MSLVSVQVATGAILPARLVMAVAPRDLLIHIVPELLQHACGAMVRANPEGIRPLNRETVADLFEDAGDREILNGHGTAAHNRNGAIVGALPDKRC